MSGAWATHGVCINCFLALNPDARPADIVPTFIDPTACCHCGETVTGGILMRASVDSMPHCTMPWVEAE